MTYHTDIHNIQTGIFILAMLCMLSSKVNGFSTVRHEAGFTECLSIGLEAKGRTETGIMAPKHIRPLQVVIQFLVRFFLKLRGGADLLIMSSFYSVNMTTKIHVAKIICTLILVTKPHYHAQKLHINRLDRTTVEMNHKCERRVKLT